MGQQNSREGSPSPIPSDSGVSMKGSSSLELTHRVHSPSPKTPASNPTAATKPDTGSEDKLQHGNSVAYQTSTHSSDFAEYKHKLERRKRKPAIENQDTSIKVAKTASESEGRFDSDSSKQTSSGNSSANEPVATEISHTASVPFSTDQKDSRKQDVIIQNRDVIVTPRSQSQRSSEAFHGACGEEAMDLSVRPTKDSFMEGLGHEHVGQRKLSLANDRDPSHPTYQSTLRRERGTGYVGVYDSSDLSDGSQHCVSPQPSLNNNKVPSNDSGSDFDSCSGSPMGTLQQDGQGREDMENAMNSPRSGTNMGGIESIVQRLHQVKSETPSRSDSEDESDYYAVTFKDLIARTISRCDRYGKAQQRGKRKRTPRTSSELSAARKEELMATKKLLERVSKNKRDKFKLTINCSTDGSEHVRNAAASEAIATLVRSVWHKENPKPIGQVIKEMVAKRLADQEGEENDPRNIGQKRKGPMTIKDILNSRSDNVVEEYNRSAKIDEDGDELLVVSDGSEKEGREDEADLAMSAAETLRKMAKSNEQCDENCGEPVPDGQQIRRESAVSEKAIDIKTKASKERDVHDDESDEEDLSLDHEQRKRAKRRSRKKKRRWARMFEKGVKINEDGTISSVPGQKMLSQMHVGQKVGVTDSRESMGLPVTEKDTETQAPAPAPKHEVTQWPAEAVKMKGSVAQNVVQMSGDVGMGTMRALVENIHDEDEEVGGVMETKEIPRPCKERAASPKRTLPESIPAPKKEPPKPVVISHSISQILEQKGSSSSVDNRSRCISRSNSVISATHSPVQLEPNTAYESSSSDQGAMGPRGPGNSSPVVGLTRRDEMMGEDSAEEGGQGEVKSMSTATEFLIRIALMQNDGNRQGAVETK
nr:uncharacterized protein LOC129257754 [Lytechinus pictus]